MANVSSDINITGVIYVAGEVINISNGATLTVDSTPATRPGNIIIAVGAGVAPTGSGRLLVTNSSTTTPIVLTLDAFSFDYRIEANGIMEVQGDMIVLGTGTNTSGQTFDLSVAPYVDIPWPSYIEVETASGSGVYVPWNVVCTAGRTVTYGTGVFGLGQNGNLLFYNATTRILSCGNGTSGNLIPTGANVRIPNIYIHSFTGNATQATRTLIDINPSGRLITNACAFSDNVFINSSANTYAEVDCTKTGAIGPTLFNNSNGATMLTDFLVSPDTQTATGGQGLGLLDVYGEIELNGVYVMPSAIIGATTATPVIQLTRLPAMTQCNKVVARYIGTRAGTGVAGIAITNPPLGLVFNNLSSTPRVLLTNLANNVINGLEHADQPGTAQSTSSNTAAVTMVNCLNVSIIGLINVQPNGSAARQSVVNVDGACANNFFYNANYDCGTNTTNLHAGNGAGTSYINCTFPEMRSTGPFIDTPATFLSSGTSLFNVRGTWNTTLANDATQGGIYDGVPGGAANWINAFNAAGNFTAASLSQNSLSPTSGQIIFASFGAGPSNVFSGTGNTTNTGFIELPGNGDSWEGESPVFKGITAFQNVAPSWSYIQLAGTSTDTTIAPTTMPTEFAVRNPGGVYSAYAALTGPNLAAALAALPGYDSDIGVQIKVRAIANTTDATRQFIRVFWSTDRDPTYLATDATITFTGPALTDEIDMVRVSDDVTLLTFTGAGTKAFTADIGESVYFVRKTSGAVEIMRTQVNPITLQLGFNGTIPLFAGAEIQLADAGGIDTIVNQTTAAAIGDAVWDAQVTDHTVAGSTGVELDKSRSAAELAAALSA